MLKDLHAQLLKVYACFNIRTVDFLKVLFSSIFDSVLEVSVNTCDSIVAGCSDHWRKNIPVLAKSHRVYSIDLIGYGYSDKPNPRQFGDDLFYTFETWATQLNEFCIDVIKDEAFFICNSIGGDHLLNVLAYVN